MTTYTTVADANGDFTVPFSSSYIGGEKITVTAEKDNTEKRIELYAPADLYGGGVIQFGGNLNNFPKNIGVVTLAGLSGAISQHSFRSAHAESIWACATGLNIQAGVTSIQSSAFREWLSMESLSLPSGLILVDNYAFDQCWSLKSLIIPESVQELGQYAFGDCRSLENLIIPNLITFITLSVFYNCLNLKNLEIKGQVTLIESNAFFNCTSLEQVIMHAITPPTIRYNTFQNIKSSCAFKVPAASVAAYKTAPEWSAYAARIQAI
jgi:BspA type Leucine rich repeat region (6 copies)